MRTALQWRKTRSQARRALEAWQDETTRLHGQTPDVTKTNKTPGLVSAARAEQMFKALKG